MNICMETVGETADGSFLIKISFFIVSCLFVIAFSTFYGMIYMR